MQATPLLGCYVVCSGFRLSDWRVRHAQCRAADNVAACGLDGIRPGQRARAAAISFLSWDCRCWHQGVLHPVARSSKKKAGVRVRGFFLSGAVPGRNGGEPSHGPLRIKPTLSGNVFGNLPRKLSALRHRKMGQLYGSSSAPQFRPVNPAAANLVPGDMFRSPAATPEGPPGLTCVRLRSTHGSSECLAAAHSLCFVAGPSR